MAGLGADPVEPLTVEVPPGESPTDPQAGRASVDPAIDAALTRGTTIEGRWYPPGPDAAVALRRYQAGASGPVQPPPTQGVGLGLGRRARGKN